MRQTWQKNTPHSFIVILVLQMQDLVCLLTELFTGFILI